MHLRKGSVSVLALAAIALVATGTTAAWAKKGADGGKPSGTVSAPLADGLAGPLQLSVGKKGVVYVAQDFAGVLTRIGNRVTSNIAFNPGGEIAGVDVDGAGKVYYTTTNATEEEGLTASGLWRLRGGVPTRVADLLLYEQTMNPDQGQTYGIPDISADCLKQWPTGDDVPPPFYTGIVDSHPYAVAVSGSHRYVAEAAGNAILDVGKGGKISTVAVLPPQPTVITAEAAAGAGLPACVVGLTYYFEPVPTDVEVGKHGMLYVTLLPGGPEDPSLGARGSVYKVDPSTGKSEKLAGGLVTAANLAIGGGGQIYVTQLFGNVVSKLKNNGTWQTVAELPNPAGLEFANGKLYVSYDVFDNGKVATIDLH